MTSYQLDRSVRRSFSALCRNAASPIAALALKALDTDDWVTLTTLKVEVGDYSDPVSYSADVQISSFFKKFPDFDLGIDLEAKALATFWDAEKQCFINNRWLDPFFSDIMSGGAAAQILIESVQYHVRRILGRCPSPHELEGRFGPGSTFADIGPYITVPDKMSDSYTLTSKASHLLGVWADTAWARYGACGDLPSTYSYGGVLYFDEPDTHYAERKATIVRGNRFTTVPKDAWKRRGICIEPSINLFYQLGIGAWISDRLGSVCGWFKKDIQERHRYWAKLGSLMGNLATIDLSNASDTISSALVELLLPRDWFLLLDSVRSTHTKVGEKWVRLEKFSSMGNGYTFELETLIFRAIALACQTEVPDPTMEGDVVSTFGDDIVVPTSSAQRVIAALEFFGMSVNKEKSFVDGPFRESCGGDYFRGYDVRPHYLKESPDEPHQFIALANGLRRFGIRHILCGGPDLYRFPWLCVLDALPTSIARCRGPEELGDLVIHDEQERWQIKVRSSIRYIRVWRPVGFGRINWFHFRPGVVFASALYGVPDGSPRSVLFNEQGCLIPDGITLRVSGSYVKGHRFGHVAYS